MDTFIVDKNSVHEPRENASEAAAHEYARTVTLRRQCEVRVLGEFGHVEHTYANGARLAT